MVNVKIQSSWKKAMQPEFEKPYFETLTQFVRHEYGSTTCYPPASLIFNAFNLCPLDQVKVVLLGQDPYHEPRQAHGLCFSVNDGVTFPASLNNIFREIELDLGKPVPQSGNLTRWAQQGVLLLNSILTVRAHEAGSHKEQGWEEFTDAVIRTVSDRANNVVFILWGNYAKSKATLIDGTRHCILRSAHPSPLSANRGGFFGNHHFSLCNAYLKLHGKTEIDW